MASRVFILGSGASLEPDFGGDVESALPGPKDYFAYARRHGLRERAALWRLLRALGIGEDALLAGRPTVDELFPLLSVARDTLWHLDHFDLDALDGESQGDDLAFDYWLTNPWDDLVAVIVEVLQHATRPLLRVPCRTHRGFAEALAPGDTVISLNYDLLMDTALLAMGGWSPADGYGTDQFLFNHGGNRSRFDLPERLPAAALAEVEPIHGGSRVRLLKLVAQAPCAVRVGHRGCQVSLGRA